MKIKAITGNGKPVTLINAICDGIVNLVVTVDSEGKVEYWNAGYITVAKPAIDDYCANILMRDALALINRQKAEIEEQDQAITKALKRIGEIRAESYKEFAERVKAESVGLFSEADIRKTVDDLVKEMTEEKTDEKIH